MQVCVPSPHLFLFSFESWPWGGVIQPYFHGFLSFAFGNNFVFKVVALKLWQCIRTTRRAGWHRWPSSPSLFDSVGLCRGSRNCILKKFPAVGAVSTTINIVCLHEMKNKWYKNVNMVLKSTHRSPYRFPPAIVSPHSSQSDRLKIWTSWYRISEPCCPSAQHFSGSLCCCCKRHFPS